MGPIYLNLPLTPEEQHVHQQTVIFAMLHALTAQVLHLRSVIEAPGLDEAARKSDLDRLLKGFNMHVKDVLELATGVAADNPPKA